MNPEERHKIFTPPALQRKMAAVLTLTPSCSLACSQGGFHSSHISSSSAKPEDPVVLEIPKIKDIAAKHKKTVAQVIRSVFFPFNHQSILVVMYSTVACFIQQSPWRGTNGDNKPIGSFRKIMPVSVKQGLLLSISFPPSSQVLGSGSNCIGP